MTDLDHTSPVRSGTERGRRPGPAAYRTDAHDDARGGPRALRAAGGGRHRADRAGARGRPRRRARPGRRGVGQRARLALRHRAADVRPADPGPASPQAPGARAPTWPVSSRRSGRRCTRFQPGDRVFGEVSGGAFAEFVVAPADWLVPVPEGVEIEQAATIGVAAETALQGLRDWGRLQPGQRVLVNGASGGVGSFAVQLAKALGASHVTAVCSTGNVEAARRAGADRVVDYTREDVRALGETLRPVLRQRRQPDPAREPAAAHARWHLRHGHLAEVEVAAPHAADAQRAALLRVRQPAARRRSRSPRATGPTSSSSIDLVARRAG